MSIKRLLVVYRTIPTSNHNLFRLWQFSFALYIVLFLHQTTTFSGTVEFMYCCISYYSYIKPQLQQVATLLRAVVYRTIPTSNHNLLVSLVFQISVVYRTIPTSNHNHRAIYADSCKVVYRTIPTSNHNSSNTSPNIGPVVYRTIPTSNHNYNERVDKYFELYIVLFLHQTTTVLLFAICLFSCISYYSYIKPQRI